MGKNDKNDTYLAATAAILEKELLCYKLDALKVFLLNEKIYQTPNA